MKNHKLENKTVFFILNRLIREEAKSSENPVFPKIQKQSRES